jgi:hypothetical protein
MKLTHEKLELGYTRIKGMVSLLPDHPKKEEALDLIEKSREAVYEAREKTNSDDDYGVA